MALYWKITNDKQRRRRKEEIPKKRTRIALTMKTKDNFLLEKDLLFVLIRKKNDFSILLGHKYKK